MYEMWFMKLRPFYGFAQAMNVLNFGERQKFSWSWMNMQLITDGCGQ